MTDKGVIGGWIDAGEGLKGCKGKGRELTHGAGDGLGSQGTNLLEDT